MPKDGQATKPAPKPATTAATSSADKHAHALCTDGRVTVQYQLAPTLLCLVQSTEALGKVSLWVKTAEGELTHGLDSLGIYCFLSSPLC